MSVSKRLKLYLKRQRRIREMINMIPFLVLFLLAVLGKSEGRGLGTVFSKIEMNYLLVMVLH